MEKKRPITAEVVSNLRGFLELQVAGGFATPAEVRQMGVDFLSDEHDPADLAPLSARLTKELLTEHLQKQKSWPEVTDCDRLDRAFAELEKNGIVARQDFTDCQTCGFAEIPDEIERAKKAGMKVRGFTFFHQQDTESAAEGFGMFLSYGSIQGSKKGSVQTGREVVKVLEKHGLKPRWNGQLSMRIELPMDWKKRRYAPQFEF